MPPRSYSSKICSRFSRGVLKTFEELTPEQLAQKPPDACRSRRLIMGVIHKAYDAYDLLTLIASRGCSVGR
jgi:hypothetical protein